MNTKTAAKTRKPRGRPRTVKPVVTFPVPESYPVPTTEPAPSKYHRALNGFWVDVYDILDLYNITNPGDQHAIKKMVMPGGRGVKTANQDRQEAIDSLVRAKQLDKSSR